MDSYSLVKLLPLAVCVPAFFWNFWKLTSAGDSRRERLRCLAKIAGCAGGALATAVLEFHGWVQGASLIAALFCISCYAYLMDKARASSASKEPGGTS